MEWGIPPIIELVQAIALKNRCAEFKKNRSKRSTVIVLTNTNTHTHTNEQNFLGAFECKDSLSSPNIREHAFTRFTLRVTGWAYCVMFNALPTSLKRLKDHVKFKQYLKNYFCKLHSKCYEGYHPGMGWGVPPINELVQVALKNLCAKFERNRPKRRSTVIVVTDTHIRVFQQTKFPGAPECTDSLRSSNKYNVFVKSVVV